MRQRIVRIERKSASEKHQRLGHLRRHTGIHVELRPQHQIVGIETVRPLAFHPVDFGTPQARRDCADSRQELKPGKGAQMGRSAGTGIQLVAKDAGYAVLRLPSGEMRRVLLTCRATVGQVGNAEHQNVTVGKAGRSRWQGKRPSVRGSAMNPVDHPHGGGEGKSKGGRHPVTPWGVPTLGKRTRAKHKESNKLIVRGRRRGKERKR